MPSVASVVAETCLLDRWVRRAAKARGATPHSDSQDCSPSCAWCAALLWVSQHVEQVRVEAIECDRKEHLTREYRRTVASEDWKREHAEDWDFLVGMLPGPFKDSVVKAVDLGYVPDKMVKALAEARDRRPVPPPDVGSSTDVVATVDKVVELNDRKGTPILRVSLTAEDGWKCRMDLSESTDIATWRQTSKGTHVLLKGRVAWCTATFAIVEGSLAIRPLDSILELF